MIVDSATLRKLAVQAECHPYTIAKLLRGEPVRGMAGHRARAVLAAAGLLQDGVSVGSSLRAEREPTKVTP